MDTIKNRFSDNFFSLQLQFKAVLEEAGGDDLLPFLDTLSALNRSEQKLMLKIMERSVRKVVASGERLETDGDLALKEFEERLFADLSSAIEEAKAPVVAAKKKISVLDGGRADNTIDFEEARRKRGQVNSDV